jgi:hypothetical protein
MAKTEYKIAKLVLGIYDLNKAVRSLIWEYEILHTRQLEKLKILSICINSKMKVMLLSVTKLANISQDAI